MTMKLIRLQHVQLKLQASTLTLATTLGATPAATPPPAPTPMLSFFAFSLLCRSLRCLRAIQFAVPARFAFFPALCLRTLIETFGGQRCCRVGVPHTHTNTHAGKPCVHTTHNFTHFFCASPAHVTRLCLTLNGG